MLRKVEALPGKSKCVIAVLQKMKLHEDEKKVEEWTETYETLHLLP
ncbi:hypothetical protein SDC9_113303 [bioreactor metagenome]|uniref:Uncharacterized protein n=1 Tax=bioreactor metagenome TaxID=1076179 RepID=A0A645BM18_9ZZZZ